jgi:hypothetical protein
MKPQLLLSIMALLSGCGFDHGTFSAFSADSDIPTAESGSNWHVPDPTDSSDSSDIEFHNTDFCKVDGSGQIISTDSLKVTTSSILEGYKEVLDGFGGGCISRPIREVWAVILNVSAMKSPDVNEYNFRTRPDLVDPSKKIYFVYDIESVVRRLAGLFEMKWVTQWYHSVTYGSYSAPDQIIVNFQKISGSSHVSYDKEGYTLDRVAPNITSFTMRQIIKAFKVDNDRVRRNIEEILQKVRSEAPLWSALPNDS